MSDGVIAALIAGGTSVIVQIVGAARQTKLFLQQLEAESKLSDTRIEAKIEKYQAVTNTRIDELTREVRVHNSFAEKIPILITQMQSIDERVSKLENKVS